MLQYHSGKTNIKPDALSHWPHDNHPPDDEWIDIAAPGVTVKPDLATAILENAVDVLGASPKAFPEVYSLLMNLDLTSLPQLNHKELKKSQLTAPAFETYPRPCYKGIYHLE